MIPTQPYADFAKEILHATFNDLQLLITAFTHRSYVNEHKKTAKEHNERLEFLGDAVLELVTTRFLFDNYPQPEGILTNWRSSLVRTESIGEAAQKNGFETLLRLSRGEKRASSERARLQILANAYEAVIGALYLDQGYDVAAKFIIETLLPRTDDIVKNKLWKDAKSFVQEQAQEHEGVTPAYRVLNETGPDHDKRFTVGLFLKDGMISEGKGKSKQEAEQDAAKAALKKKGWAE